MREHLKQTQRIVIKVGTSILTSSQGRISQECLERLGRNVLQVLKMKKQAAVVSSGAIAYGMETCGYKRRPKHLAELQACAAIGQGRLMHAYEQFFSRKQVVTAQLLLTRDGLETPDRFLAARNTFKELFKMGALPIVNENDTVATEEISFGDNDILSVHVAHLIHADLLIIMSDVNGFFLKDGSRLRQVSSRDEIDQNLVKHLKDTKKETTVGGMRAKLEAAKVAMRLGVSLMIVNGHEEAVIQKALKGEDVGTLFVADKNPRRASLGLERK
ncbi:MAG: glutamate 5-kinase [Candidatus Omnitrophica bacterium]|nr:glutamate 5-kinase [Candidatus Omnitrophota bacterium]